MMNADAHDENLPFPPRFWWLKRILASAGVLLVALLGVRWWWGWDAERKLQAKIAEYHALGQPITLEDFQLPPIPDEENAAYFLKQAAEKISEPTDVRVKFEDAYWDLGYITSNSDDIRRTIEANSDVFTLVDRAAKCPDVDWGWKLSSPMMGVTYLLAPIRKLARLLSTTALYEHSLGRDAEALNIVRRIRFIADSSAGRNSNLIPHLVSMANETCAILDIEHIAPNLRIGFGNDVVTAATPEQIRELIDSFLNEDAFRKSGKQAFQGERLCILDTHNVETATPGTAFSPPVLNRWQMFLLKPSITHDTIRMIELCDRCELATQLRTRYLWALVLVSNYPDFPCHFERMVHLFSNHITPSYTRFIELHFRNLALRRMSAVALALRLFEVEQGRRPSKLDELVPDYLTDVPIDPFSTDQLTLSYLPNAAPPILYSVGADRVDDGGRYALYNNGTVDQNELDLVPKQAYMNRS